MENECLKIPIKDTAILDIEVNGERIRFENLNAKQVAALVLLDSYKLNHQRRSAQPHDIKEVTGFDTMAEHIAFEKGYDACQNIMMEWIAKWDGKSNSALGSLINAKIKALKEFNTEPLNLDNITIYLNENTI